MVEQGEGRPLPVSVAPASPNQYPAPLAKYEDVVASRQLFMTTLEKLHAAMGTKFMYVNPSFLFTLHVPAYVFHKKGRIQLYRRCSHKNVTLSA